MSRVLTTQDDPLSLEFRLMEIAESKKTVSFRLARTGETVAQARWMKKSKYAYPLVRLNLRDDFDQATADLERFEREILEA